MHADSFKASHLFLDSYEKAGVGALVDTTHTRLEGGVGCGISLCEVGLASASSSEDGMRVLPNVRAAIGYTF